jgi:RimJ/RimL family protein N-acetyltransferase
MYTSLENWSARERPSVDTLVGNYVLLEKLDATRHGEALFEASSTTDGEERFRWLGERVPTDRDGFMEWVQTAAASSDPYFYAVIDKATGKVAGRQAFLRIDTANGVIEIGAILWNPPVGQRPAATEALYLFARHAFDELGYRRFEWKCNNENKPSKRAALRFGFTFEGIFRQHMVVKGKTRDTAWFSMIDAEWPQLRAALEEWLDPSNFDSEGRQRKRLEEIRAAHA